MKHLLIFSFLLLPLHTFAQQTADTPKYLMPAFGTDTSRPATVVPQKSALELLWDEQTVSGQNAIVEKVTAGFFRTGKGAGIYAFHNVAPRGTVLRVKNMNNDRIIYVKVLGPMAATRQFKGCTLGLSDAAKVSLDVRDWNAFCEISYMSY